MIRHAKYQLNINRGLLIHYYITCMLFTNCSRDKWGSLGRFIRRFQWKWTINMKLKNEYQKLKINFNKLFLNLSTFWMRCQILNVVLFIKSNPTRNYLDCKRRLKYVSFGVIRSLPHLVDDKCSTVLWKVWSSFDNKNNLLNTLKNRIAIKHYIKIYQRNKSKSLKIQKKHETMYNSIELVDFRLIISNTFIIQEWLKH